jgi:hypothetical protein
MPQADARCPLSEVQLPRGQAAGKAVVTQSRHHDSQITSSAVTWLLGVMSLTAAGPQARHSPSAVLRLHWQGKSIIKPSQALECLILAAFAKRLPVHFPGEAIRMIDLPNVA